MIIVDNEIDFFKLFRQLKILKIRKVEKSSQSNIAHNSYIYEENYKFQEGKNYYGKKRRNYSDYS